MDPSRYTFTLPYLFFLSPPALRTVHGSLLSRYPSDGLVSFARLESMYHCSSFMVVPVSFFSCFNRIRLLERLKTSPTHPRTPSFQTYSFSVSTSSCYDGWIEVVGREVSLHHTESLTRVVKVPVGLDTNRNTESKDCRHTGTVPPSNDPRDSDFTLL